LWSKYWTHSIWYHRQYKVNKVIAVEPNPDNAALVRLNFLQNSINGHIIEGAVGSVDGFGVFRRCKDSNVGHLVQEPAAVGEEIGVPVVSMQTVLASLAEDESVDLLKLDIEGGEQDLLTGNLGWLQRVRAIIAEFHPPLVDYHVLTGLIATRGFHYIAANTVSGNMDSFVRAASIAESDSFTGK
jgi:FkbM family methyltransferase